MDKLFQVGKSGMLGVVDKSLVVDTLRLVELDILLQLVGKITHHL